MTTDDARTPEDQIFDPAAVTAADIYVRPTRPEDFAGIAAISRRVYPRDEPWTPRLLQLHREQFSEGQLVAAVRDTEQVVGMAATLILRWDAYEIDQAWRDFTDHGTFANHDPQGKTLYGAEVMVDPALQRSGIGSKLYAARRTLARALGLPRIRAGARLRGYHRYADTMSADAYVRAVVTGEIGDRTLSFQFDQAFLPIAVVEGYMPRHKDPESLGWATVIEWLNPEVATDAQFEQRARRARRFGAEV